MDEEEEDEDLKQAAADEEEGRKQMDAATKIAALTAPKKHWTQWRHWGLVIGILLALVGMVRLLFIHLFILLGVRLKKTSGISSLLLCLPALIACHQAGKNVQTVLIHIQISCLHPCRSCSTWV